MKISLSVPLAFAIWALFTSERSHPKARSEEAKEETRTGNKGAMRRRAERYVGFPCHGGDYSQGFANENPKIAGQGAVSGTCFGLMAG
ncbi:hypothetical protein EGN72_16125 [Pseudorhodobacter sp. E13]|nr:hypothetical protein EGN72_16125 [Pseudorhodobacter sp. E13]